MLALALGTGRFLAPENKGLEPVLALGANVFKDGHMQFSALKTNIRGLLDGYKQGHRQGPATSPEQK